MPLFSHHTPRPDAAPPDRAPTTHLPRSGAAPAAGSTATALLRRYRPLETRASGGFGSVEVCLDSRLQRRVAIKRMPLASRFGTAPAETSAAALAEARTASMLAHPHIVSVIDFTYDAAYAYLVMEYVDGLSLEEFLAQVEGGSLTYDECAAVADALVQALAFAHENGVLHLDIKPANVLIDRNGNVKLADFGMATLTSAAGFGDARGGTIGYMPPEQLSGEAVDARADIFSLAAVLYEALCAEAPFRAGTPADSLKRIKKGAPAPSDLLPDLPELSEEALLTALSPRADARQASVAAFGDAFLAQLGNPREGRRSLARMIARLTADDPDDPALADEDEAPTRPVDPAEGVLGSRTPRARALVTGAVAGVACAAGAVQLLGSLEGVDGAGGAVVALAVGAAAAVAPQLGSALLAGGFLLAAASATDLVAGLPVTALALAAFCGWWYAWGRVAPGASAAFLVAMAFGAAAGSPALAVGAAAALGGYLLAPGAAAASVGLGAAFAQLMIAARAGGGALGAAAAAAALAQPGSLGAIAVGAGAAAAAALLCTLADGRDGWRPAFTALACSVLGFMVVLLQVLANPMENGGTQTYGTAVALGVGCLSSILLWLCVYLMGYRKQPAEGDRS